MRPHVSAETMARFRQGDLSQRRTSQISTHLAECDRCCALNDDLGGVTALLASTQPPPMPEHLTARIQAALAAEAAGRGAAPAPGRAVPARSGWRPRMPGIPRIPRMSSRTALRGLAAAAVVLLLAGGGYELAVHGSGSSSSGSSGPVAAPAARPATRAPANGAMVPALPSFGPALQYQHAGRRDSITPITTGTDFTPAQLTSQVTAEVTKYGAGFAKTGPNAKSPGQPGAVSPAAVPGVHAELFANLPVPELRGCVNRIAAGNLVLLVDVARFRDAPATVIVTEVAEIGPLQIWVVGTGCSAARSDVLERATATAPS